MTSDLPDPSSLVKVAFDLGEPEYLRVAELFGWDEAWGKEVGDLLYGRPGWHCEIVYMNGGPGLLWSFGAMGASLFNISPDEDGGYPLFDYEADATHRFPSIADLRAWLDDNENRHDDHLKRLHGLTSASEWRILKTIGFDLDVTIDGSTWIATARKLPVTMSTGATLSEVVTNAREAIAATFDAPNEMARDIEVRIHLDEKSAAAI